MRIRAPEDLGAVARQHRRDAGLSQEDVAARAGVTRQWLVRFEGGNAEVSLSKAFAVLRALDITVNTTTSGESRGNQEIRIPRVEMPLLTMEALGRSIQETSTTSSEAMMSSIRETIRQLDAPSPDDSKQS